MITQSCHSSGGHACRLGAFSLLRISSGLCAHTRLPVTDGRREHADHHGPALDLLGEPSPGTVRSPVRRSRRPTHNPSSAASSRASRPEYHAIAASLSIFSGTAGPLADTPCGTVCGRRLADDRSGLAVLMPAGGTHHLAPAAARRRGCRCQRRVEAPRSAVGQRILGIPLAGVLAEFLCIVGTELACCCDRKCMGVCERPRA